MSLPTPLLIPDSASPRALASSQDSPAPAMSSPTLDPPCAVCETLSDARPPAGATEAEALAFVEQRLRDAIAHVNEVHSDLHASRRSSWSTIEDLRRVIRDRDLVIQARPRPAPQASSSTSTQGTGGTNRREVEVQTTLVLGPDVVLPPRVAAALEDGGDGHGPDLEHLLRGFDLLLDFSDEAQERQAQTQLAADRAGMEAEDLRARLIQRSEAADRDRAHLSERNDALEAAVLAQERRIRTTQTENRLLHHRLESAQAEHDTLAAVLGRRVSQAVTRVTQARPISEAGSIQPEALPVPGSAEIASRSRTPPLEAADPESPPAGETPLALDLNRSVTDLAVLVVHLIQSQAIPLPPVLASIPDLERRLASASGSALRPRENRVVGDAPLQPSHTRSGAPFGSASAGSKGRGPRPRPVEEPSSEPSAPSSKRPRLANPGTVSGVSTGLAATSSSSQPAPEPSGDGAGRDQERHELSRPDLTILSSGRPRLTDLGSGVDASVESAAVDTLGQPGSGPSGGDAGRDPGHSESSQQDVEGDPRVTLSPRGSRATPADLPPVPSPRDESDSSPDPSPTPSPAPSPRGGASPSADPSPVLSPRGGSGTPESPTPSAFPRPPTPPRPSRRDSSDEADSSSEAAPADVMQTDPDSPSSGPPQRATPPGTSYQPVWYGADPYDFRAAMASVPITHTTDQYWATLALGQLVLRTQPSVAEQRQGLPAQIPSPILRVLLPYGLRLYPERLQIIQGPIIPSDANYRQLVDAVANARPWDRIVQRWPGPFSFAPGDPALDVVYQHMRDFVTAVAEAWWYRMHHFRYVDFAPPQGPLYKDAAARDTRIKNSWSHRTRASDTFLTHMLRAIAEGTITAAIVLDPAFLMLPAASAVYPWVPDFSPGAPPLATQLDRLDTADPWRVYYVNDRTAHPIFRYGASRRLDGIFNPESHDSDGAVIRPRGLPPSRGVLLGMIRRSTIRSGADARRDLLDLSRTSRPHGVATVDHISELEESSGDSGDDDSDGVDP